jgi:hypothetical protein
VRFGPASQTFIQFETQAGEFIGKDLAQLDDFW